MHVFAWQGIYCCTRREKRFVPYLFMEAIKISLTKHNKLYSPKFKISINMMLEFQSLYQGNFDKYFSDVNKWNEIFYSYIKSLFRCQNFIYLFYSCVNIYKCHFRRLWLLFFLHNLLFYILRVILYKLEVFRMSFSNCKRW